MIEEKQIEELIKKWQERSDELEYRIASYCHHGVSMEATPPKGQACRYRSVYLRPPKPFKTTAMTTEQMNRDIAEYLGWEWNERGYYHVTNMGIFYRIRPNYCPDELEFHKDWAVLLPVWQKLRGELDYLGVDEYGMVKDSDYIVSKYAIEKTILSCNITTAHRLIVEAIELIKNK